MPQPRLALRGRRRAALLPTALLAALLTAGCSGAQADSGTPGPPPGKASPSGTARPSSSQSCRKPAPADVPGAAGALTQADSGTFCLALGSQIDVFLTAPGGQKPGVTRWTPVSTSAPHVLAPRTSGILTAPVGVTPAVFQALTPGTAALTSNVPGTAHTWHVTILIR